MSVTFDLPPHVMDEIVERVAALVIDRLSADRADQWLDVTAAARHLGFTKGRIYKLVERNEIPHVQDGPGCKLSFSRCALDSWMEERGAR